MNIPPKSCKLVEDLWNDPAAAPDEVLVHDWQKEELERRKKNLLENPASGSTWDEGKASGPCPLRGVI